MSEMSHDDEPMRGLGKVEHDTYDEQFLNCLTFEEAQFYGGDIIVYLEEEAGVILAYRGRFTRVREDVVSFIIFPDDKTTEGRRFKWDDKGKLSPPDLDQQTEAQRLRFELGGYI